MVVKDLDRPLTIAMFLNFDSSEIKNELTESTYDIGEKYLKTKVNISNDGHGSQTTPLRKARL